MLIKQMLKKLDTIIELLSAEKEARESREEEKKREENERRLREYAMRKHKKYPATGIHSSREMENMPLEGAKDFIPYGLSDTEREILHLWYGPS